MSKLHHEAHEVDHGHYFKFERGEWTKDGDKPTKFCQASGLSYVGSLTAQQRDDLDALIKEFLGNRDTPKPQAAHGAGAGEVVARWKFELRQAIVEYGAAVKVGNAEAIRETTQRGCDLIDAYPMQSAPVSPVSDFVTSRPLS